MNSVPPTYVKSLRRARKLAICLTIVSLLFVSLFVVHSQDPANPTLKGESATVLLGPNRTVDAREIRFKADSDHDGMPDEKEIENGTNPNDPSDADGDADGDGLSNGDEVAMGSGVNNADSDSDGVNDGEEARLGFNPNDATSTPPVNATIVSIQVTPSPLELSRNTALGPQPAQLQVSGTLNTGAIVDLTLSPDTTYTSLDTNVATVNNAGIALGVAVGSTTITVQNGSFTVQVPVTVSNYSPVSVAEISIPGYANGVAVQGTYVFVAAGVTGLQIVDVSNRRVPRIVGSFDTPGNANAVKVAGNFAYVADGDAGLVIIDVSNKNAPFGVGFVDTPGVAQGVAVNGTFAYIADGLTGLQIINVSDVAAPFIAGSVDTPGTAKGVDVLGNLAAIADMAPANGLRLINVNQPQSPVIVGNLTLTGQARTVVLGNSVAYVATNANGLRVVSTATPSAPQLLGTSSGTIRDIAVVGNFAFGPLVGSGSLIISVENPINPVVRGSVNFNDLPSTFTTGPGGVAADQQYVYVTRSLSGVVENGVSGNTFLAIGRYNQTVYDRAGVAPSMAVVSPQNGQTVIQGHTINLTADAIDDVEVERVQFFVDNQLIATDRIPPYETPALIGGTAPTRTIKVTATDLNGVSAESAPVTINTIPNPAPVVSLLSPQTGSLLIEGQTIELLAQASDDGRVASITFTAGGVNLPQDTSPPFKTTFTVPTGVTSLTISARANDNQGLTATVTETFAVTPPIATTVTGRVITLSNQPVDGATVSAFGQGAVTASDGSFSIANVPTSLGPISVTASAVLGGQQLNGISRAVAPAPGGIVNVGNVLLQPAHLETEIGNLITFAGPSFDDRSAAVALPFSFTYYGVTYTQVFVGTNGYLTFGSGSTAFNEIPTNFANGLPRIAVLFDDWDPDQASGRGVFANTQLPGKTVFTWSKIEHAVNNGNDDVSEEGTFQIVLFGDGRIQFGYGKVETLGGLVGISPGGTPTAIPVKHTALQGINVGITDAPYERFLGLGDVPFDLQHAFITYSPNSSGYSVEVQRAPETRVRGRILQPDSSLAGGARVTVFNRTVVTEADGSFVLEGVPAFEGTILVKAALVLPDGRLFSGQSTAVRPVVNGETDIGDLTLTARGFAFETELGQPVPHASGAFPKTEFVLQFPFRIYGQSFYGQTFNRVFLNSQGFLSLTDTCVQSGCNDRFGLTSSSVNDLIFAFANTPVIAPFFSTLDPGNTGQVFVNSLPDKWVMTFVNVQQPGRPETNTFQVVLHADGAIRFAYDGIGNTHGHVGISTGLFWGLSEDTWTIDWTSGPVRRVPNPYPVFEMFQGGLTNVTGRNFDIDRNVLVFFPNTDGSYEVIRQQFTGPVSTSKILFDGSVSGNNDFFSINPEGSDRINLTINPVKISTQRSRLMGPGSPSTPIATIPTAQMQRSTRGTSTARAW